MSSSVKTVFKIIITTIFLMVAIPVVVEIYNMNISGMQLKRLTKMAAYNACVLVNQETYYSKGSDAKSGSGAVKMDSIRNIDTGMQYLTGDFYEKTTTEEIWNKIYTSSAFQHFSNLSENGSTHESITLPNGGGSVSVSISIPKSTGGTSTAKIESLKSLYTAASANNISTLRDDVKDKSSDIEWNTNKNSTTYKEYKKASEALAYREQLFTANNLGIPYMDPQITNNIFQWNLAKLLGSGTDNTVQTDPVADDQYVNYKGFKIHADKAWISSYEYRTFDLNNQLDKNEFKTLTGMDVAANASSTEGIYIGSVDGENKYVTVVLMEYNVPISYKGITPIREVFNYGMNRTRVVGMGNTAPNTQATWGGDTATNMYVDANGSNGTGSADIISSGRLMYTLVR